MTSAPAWRILLDETDGAAPMAAAGRFELLRTLLEKGLRLRRIRDLAALEPAAEEPVLILSPRPAPPAQLDGHGIAWLPIAGLDVPAILDRVEALLAEHGASRNTGWKPWFPVIDYHRCTHCMQCLSFCLFDVYGVAAGGRLVVQKPANCKTDCPACSRVCPEVAILFPKYSAGPINGEEVRAEDVRRESMKIDISSLLGGNVMSELRDRSARARSRFSKERSEDRALAERQRCLARLQAQMDIPPEVLASLPSPDEIRIRAEQARARAEEAIRSTPRP